MSSLSDRVFAGHLRLGLAQKLQLAGINVSLPSELIDAHKAHMLAGRSLFLRLLWLTLSTLSLMRPLSYLDRRLSNGLPLGEMGAAIGMFGGTLILGTVLCMFAEGVSLAGIELSAVVVFAWWLIAIASLILSDNEGLLFKANYWSKVSLTEEGESFYVVFAGSWFHRPAFNHRLPDRLADRARAAKSIPGVRLEVEGIDDDPILNAVTGWWIFAERVPIGAWNTFTNLDSL